MEEWRQDQADTYWTAFSNIADVSREVFTLTPEYSKRVLRELVDVQPAARGRPFASVRPVLSDTSPVSSPASSTRSLVGVAEDAAEDDTQDSRPTALRAHSSPTTQPALTADNDFVFEGSAYGHDVGKEFNVYNHLAIQAEFHHRGVSDYLAGHGILYLPQEPTAMQKRCFVTYNAVRDSFLSDLPVPDEEQFDKLLTAFRSCKDAYERAHRKTKKESEARNALLQAVSCLETGFLKDLLHHGCQSLDWKKERPETEADLVASFVVPQMSTLFTIPGHSRLIPSATAPPEANLFLYKLQDLVHSPKHPDIIVRGRGVNIEFGFAEVSTIGIQDTRKNAGDFARICIWGKKASDAAFIRYQDPKASTVLFQVQGEIVTLYTLCRVGSVCVVVEAGSCAVYLGLEDMLRNLEKDLFTLVTVQVIFQAIAEDGHAAANCLRQGPAPHLFQALLTPSARTIQKESRNGDKSGIRDQVKSIDKSDPEIGDHSERHQDDKSDNQVRFGNQRSKRKHDGDRGQDNDDSDNEGHEQGRERGSIHSNNHRKHGKRVTTSRQ
ncbi:hypothetical protein BGZ98_007610 [Dissophora globulifera]|nr:hypothetical protein BGZ98_007610 [Dissophora globulifera]